MASSPVVGGVVLLATAALLGIASAILFSLPQIRAASTSPRRIGYSGTPSAQLRQPPSFYEQQRDATLKYLSAVYPVAASDFAKMTATQLASFYNSLVFYYNGQFQHSTPLPISDDSEPKTWGAVSSWAPMPYVPQGTFYDFESYQNQNVPVVTYDSTESVDAAGACRPGIALAYIDRENRAGPGQARIMCRSLERQVYAPSGLDNPHGIDAWSASIHPSVSLRWSYPDNWSVLGIPSGGYLEVALSGATPGSTQSPGAWWTVLPGTGIFLSVGTTFVANNKTDALLKMCKRIKSQPQGSDWLDRHFGTDDAYELAWGFLGYCGYDSATSTNYCNWDAVDCIKFCAMSDSGVLKASGLVDAMNLPTYRLWEFTVYYQKKHGISQSDTPSEAAIQIVLNHIAEATDYECNRASWVMNHDEPLFLMSVYLGLDTLQMPMSANENGFWSYDVLDTRLPGMDVAAIRSKVKDRDYSDIIVQTTKGMNTPLTPLPSEEAQASSDGNYYSGLMLKAWYTTLVQSGIVSVRNPLNVYDSKGVRPCKGMDSAERNDWLNAFCEGTLSQDFRSIPLGFDVPNA